MSSDSKPLDGPLAGSPLLGPAPEGPAGGLITEQMRQDMLRLVKPPKAPVVGVPDTDEPS